MHAFHDQVTSHGGPGLEYQKWYMLPFKSDFFKTLERHGRLPATSLEAKLKTSTALDRIRSGLKIKQDISSMDEPQLKLFLRDSLNVGTVR